MTAIYRSFKVLILALFFAIATQGLSVVDSNTLVLYDEKVTSLDSHSLLFEDLKDRGFQLTFETFGDNVSLYSLNYKLFQNVVIFPSKQRSLGANLKPSKLLDFVNDGGDVLVVTSPEGLSDDVRIFLNELGIYPSPKNYKVIDHFSSISETHDVLQLDLTSANQINSIINSKEIANPAVYEGSAALLSNSQLLVPIIRTPATSYTTDDIVNPIDSDHSWTIGSQGFLSVGFQARNSARVAWIGSSSFLSDESFQSSESNSNRKIMEDITRWVFQEKGVIKVTSVDHFHADEHLQGLTYKIKDEVIYQIGISEWNSDEANWKPFVADDIQLEFTMLDPYQRLTLVSVGQSNDGESEIYSVKFKIPDQHGMFTFTTNYKRPGLSFIEEKDVVTVRHLANDEYPRSWDITNSWVYITSFLTVIIGWITFVVLFLYTGNVKTVSGTNSKKNL